MFSTAFCGAASLTSSIFTSANITGTRSTWPTPQSFWALRSSSSSSSATGGTQARNAPSGRTRLNASNPLPLRFHHRLHLRRPYRDGCRRRLVVCPQPGPPCGPRPGENLERGHLFDLDGAASCESLAGFQRLELLHGPSARDLERRDVPVRRDFLWRRFRRLLDVSSLRSLPEDAASLHA